MTVGQRIRLAEDHIIVFCKTVYARKIRRNNEFI